MTRKRPSPRRSSHRPLSGASYAASLVVLVATLLGCEDPPKPGSSYFDERIAPNLRVGCVEQTAGCHLASTDGLAAGNLDLSTYDALMRRKDVLAPYGPYPVGLLLMKGSEPAEIQVDTIDPPDPGEPSERFVRVKTDIRHNAGAGIQLSSQSANLLKQWISAGYTRTGVPRNDLAESTGACRSGVGIDSAFDADKAPADAKAYAEFKSKVQPVLLRTCAGGACHASPIADLHLACGDTEEELRWNYFIATQHIADPVSTSELLRRPLAASAGGTFHEGGDVFQSTDDPGYVTLREWAEDLVKDNPDIVKEEGPSDGLRFFANRVEPVLVRKGCMFLNCHSPAMFHDLRLRNGSQGTFSRVAIRKNYEMSRALLALESPDPNQSRIIAKNLYPADQVEGGHGMAHRGGFLFEDFGTNGANPISASLANCDGVDADAGDLNEIPAYCVLARWHAIERQDAIDRGEVDAETLTGVVWVARPDGVGDIRDFDTFRGDADLRFATATVDADGAATLGASTSLLGDCGLSGNVDVRTPAVSWDGKRIAFAARTSASKPLRLYWMNADGTDCEAVPDVAADDEEDNGIAIHDFDPAFAPDGRLVFASTRGNLGSGYSYSGPTRTPAAFQPNANLYIYEPDEKTNVRQLTFLLNQEVAPNFMSDGRLIFTTEKREPDFQQLALRRMNLDGGDYHPLFAQRSSIGFHAATEVVELPNRNLAFVAGPVDAKDGASTIALVNRSVGPDQNDRDPADRFYIHSLTFPAPGAFGGMEGVFRSPAALPTGRILVSCDLSVESVTAGARSFALCEIDPTSGDVRELGGEAGVSNVEAVGVYARANHGVFRSRIDEVNGTTIIDKGETDAVVTYHDFPLISTLLFANIRTSRVINRKIGGFEVLEALPPPEGAADFADAPAKNVIEDDFGKVYEDYNVLGWAGLEADGSARVRVPGGTPLRLRITNADGNVLTFDDDAPFTGELIQKEESQFYPGERVNQSMPRRFFNGLCGGCHGSITGRELDIAVNVDVLSGASQTLSADLPPVDLMR